MNWYLYNSTDKDIQIDTFKIKLKPKQTLNLRQTHPSLSDSFIMNEVENGCLFEFILNKQLYITNTDNRVKPDVSRFAEAKPFARRTLAIKQGKLEASKFIEELQSAFDGKILHQQPEDLISKNTAALLSQSEFDGVQDILDEEDQ